jgi:hypothetical protein
MTCQPIDDKLRVWTITLGADGKLIARLDAERLAALTRRPERLAA